MKAIKLRNSTSITLRWVTGRAGLKGNERADYLAKTVARYNTRVSQKVILFVVLYGCETWSLTLREERRLRVFENVC